MLPNFVIIGAMKSGTTSLHHYLYEHPDICMSQQKETNFFIGNENYDRGVPWYESLFCDCAAKARGEASPNYTMYPIVQGVPERMHALIPHAKLIYLLRDPIERIVSHYIHRHAKEREPRSLADALAGPLEDSIFVPPSLYHMQLTRYLKYFPAENILVITAEDLRDNRIATLQRVFRFLDVDADFQSPSYANEYHLSSRKTMNPLRQSIMESRAVQAIRPLVPAGLKRAYRNYEQKTAPRPSMPRSLKARLVDRLAPDVEALRAHTGERFEHWSL